MALHSASVSQYATIDLESKHQRSETGHVFEPNMESNNMKQFNKRTFPTTAFPK